MPKIQKGAWGSATTVTPVPEIENQVGPTCGLTALSIVMKFWYQVLMAKYAKSPMEQPIAPLPSARDPKAKSMRENLMEEIRGAGGKPKKLEKSSLPTILPTMQDIAEKMGSRIGEVAQAHVLARIARQAGAFNAKVERWNDTLSMINLIKSQIDLNIPCIIAYDNTDTGDPGTGNKGDRAHWAVIFGYTHLRGANYLLATHGWGNYYLWLAEELRKSNEQLERYDAKAGTWVNVETGDKPSWNLRDKSAPESSFKVGNKTSTTTGYDLSTTHKAFKWVKNNSTGQYEKFYDPKETSKVRGFAPVDSHQDLQRQLVIVTPMGETEFKPTQPIVSTAPTTVVTGKGDLY